MKTDTQEQPKLTHNEAHKLWLEKRQHAYKLMQLDAERSAIVKSVANQIWNERYLNSIKTISPQHAVEETR